jgi:hypothetical protein
MSIDTVTVRLTHAQARDLLQRIAAGAVNFGHAARRREVVRALEEALAGKEEAMPDPESPTTGDPQDPAEQPQGDAPKADAPQADQPATDEPKTE